MVSAPDVSRATPTEALVDVVQSAQRLVISQIDLLRLEAKDAASIAAKKGVLFGAAAFLGMLGWIALMAAVVVLLAGPLPTSAALAIVGGAHVIAAVLLALSGRAQHPVQSGTAMEVRR